MESQDSGEAQRRAAVQECLESNIIDPARRGETEEFLEVILLLKAIGSTQPVVNKEYMNRPIIKQEDRSNSVSSDTVLVELPLSTIQRFTPSSPSSTLQDQAKATLHLKDTQGSPKGYLITPEEENLLTPIVESLPDWNLQSDSSVLSSPPERVLTPEGWSSNGDHTVYSSGHTTPTMARLEKLCEFADANWSAFNALLDVARVAVEERDDPDAYMTLEKVEVAGILLQLDEHHQSSSLNNPKMRPADSGMFTTPEGKGQTVTPAQTREDVLRRMGDQFRRTGMKPAAALGGLPVTPSSTIQHHHLFSPTCKTYQKKHYSQYPLASHQQDKGYDSDRTVDDPSWTPSDSDSDMPLAERKKKQVAQPQYNGPPRFLLDPNRTDPIAMAAKNNHPGGLNDIPSILAVSNSKPSFLVSHPQTKNPAAAKPQQSEYSKFNLVCPSSTQNKSQFGGGDGLWEEGRDTENNISHPEDLEKLRADRKARNDKEMYEGLKRFKGNQRGWNAEHESDRQETLSNYHIEEERKAQEVYEKEKAALKGKDPTPRKKRLELTYNVTSKKQILAAKAKDVEEAYSERYAKGLQEGQNYDDYIGALTAQNHKDIMKRPWDHDQIKREALEANKARAEEQRAKTEADSGFTSDLSQTSKNSNDLAGKNLKRKEIAEEQHNSMKQKKVRL